MTNYRTPAYLIAACIAAGGFVGGFMAGSASEGTAQSSPVTVVGTTVGARTTQTEVITLTSTDRASVTSTSHVTETVYQTEPAPSPESDGCDVTGDAVALAWQLFDTGDFTGYMVTALGQEDSAMVDEILWQREQTESGGTFDMRGLLCAHPEWINETADERGVER